MRQLDAYGIVLFDCDGVILDSNPVKTEVFRAVLAAYPTAVVERFVAEHRASGGISRYVKLRRFFTEMVAVPDPEQAIEQAIEQFSTKSQEALLGVSLVAGVRTLLEGLQAPSYVVSGADQHEVRDVLAAHDLAHHFVDILGSPTAKREHVSALAQSGRLTRPGLFLGDALEDMRVAEAQGLDFVFVAGVSDWNEGAAICTARGHRVVQDLTAL